MVERSFLPILVISQSQNNAEKINGLLRSAGHAVRSEWASTLDEVETSLQQQRPDLIFCFLKVPEAPAPEVMAIHQQRCPESALLMVTGKMEDAVAGAVMERGARDLVSMDNERRLLAVVKRELDVIHAVRELKTAQALVAEYQSRFQDFMEESGDALAYVQDGILMQANPAFAEMFGFGTPDDLEGFPVMDLFNSKDQGKLKAALVAISKGKDVAALEINGLKDGTPFSTKLEFDQTELDGESCVEIAIRSDGVSAEAQEQMKAEMQAEMEEMGRRDPLTGLYHRHYFVQLVNAGLKNRGKEGVGALLIIKPDHFSQIEEKVGPLASDNVLKLLGTQLRDLAQGNDQVARFGGNIFAALITRKKLPDIQKFAEDLKTSIASRIFEAGGQSTSMTVSIGIADLENEVKNAGQLISIGQQANKEAREKGGNRVVLYKPAEVDEEGKLLDAGWIKKITTALKNNYFQLVYQPIASLEGDVSEMFDILVRMKDEDGTEIMPGEFFPAAERNNLMSGIDRWIINKALAKLAERIKEGKKAKFFIRISEKTLADNKLIEWIDQQLSQYRLPPDCVIFQIAEATAEKRLRETKSVEEVAAKHKQGVALEHFGIGHNSMQMFDHIGMRFLKIDGSFMAVLGSDPAKREAVQAFIEKARELKIETVAERVENANTMAVLWQLGINFIQGNYVQEPEVVMAEDARLPA